MTLHSSQNAKLWCKKDHHHLKLELIHISESTLTTILHKEQERIELGDTISIGGSSLYRVTSITHNETNKELELKNKSEESIPCHYLNFIHEIQKSKNSIFTHPIYEQLHNEQLLKLFMESHIYCVWDFQSLIKALQKQYTGMIIPWTPSSNAHARRIINEIVLEEESDIGPNGEYLSHYELYLQAMQEAGADTENIKNFIHKIEESHSLHKALESSTLNSSVTNFLNLTFEIIEKGKAHLLLALFSEGRENLIPDFFHPIVQQLSEHDPKKWNTFKYYLERHIEIDGDQHGPHASTLFWENCSNEQPKWDEALFYTKKALQYRKELLDEVLHSFQTM